MRAWAETFFYRGRAEGKRKAYPTGYKDNPWYAAAEWTYKVLRQHWGQKPLTADDQYRLAESIQQREMPVPRMDAWSDLRSELKRQYGEYWEELRAEYCTLLRAYPQSPYASQLPVQIAGIQCRLALVSEDFETPLRGQVKPVQLNRLYDLLLSQARLLQGKKLVQRIREEREPPLAGP